MRIFVTGQCTVHLGRLEFGNIGNYYITETLFRELHRVFPGATIVTTFQMTDAFCARENITRLPMELFYAWTENDLHNSRKELEIAKTYDSTGTLIERTPFINEVLRSDLIIDFSGEMWGDHAEPVGENRFLVGLLKDRVAQLLGKPVVLLAGSQGPFTNPETKELAKQVFANFTAVLNRESASEEILRREGFNISKVRNFTCPAFLFEGSADTEIQTLLTALGLNQEKPNVGMILCGFNMLNGPYDKTPRCNDEFVQFAQVVEFIVNDLGAKVFLMSHQNGFELEPKFRLINGRDFPYAKQLHEVVGNRGNVNMRDTVCLPGPYDPAQTKAIIRQFDMFVSGRIHGFVAATSQAVPTVIITRGHGGVSHRNIGFARSVGLDSFVANPASASDMICKVKSCWDNREELRSMLSKRIADVKETARGCFDNLKSTVNM